MIEFTTGNIMHADAEALVNSVNCVGHMGRGLALQFKKVWPDNFKAYARACQSHLVRPGAMFIHETGRTTNPRYIINFPTKRHWRNASRMEDIEAGLTALVAEIQNRAITSIAIPPLGAGLGGLDWIDVRERIVHAMRQVPDVRVIIYEPSDIAEHAVVAPAASRPAMTPGRAALIALIDRYLAGLLDPFITLLEVHKLMYFLQMAGEPLRLRFVKGVYGPYAENLRHVLHAIEGHYITGYGTGGDAPKKTLELMPGVVREATQLLEEQPETRQRMSRVAEAVTGFESPFGLELLATVHWLLSDSPCSDEELVKRTYAWGARKRQFNPRQILLAAQVLREKGLLASP